jgi:hypothetical protein
MMQERAEGLIPQSKPLVASHSSGISSDDAGPDQVGAPIRSPMQ